MFFFFQAEDGIRDGHVTGVQTCALPISTRGESESAMRYRRSNLPTEDAAPVTGAQPAARSTFRVPGRGTHRSEERRVGKEGRAGRAGEQSRERRPAKKTRGR